MHVTMPTTKEHHGNTKPKVKVKRLACLNLHGF